MASSALLLAMMTGLPTSAQVSSSSRAPVVSSATWAAATLPASLAWSNSGASCTQRPVRPRFSPAILSTLPVMVTTKAVLPISSNVVGRSSPDTTGRN